MEAPLKQQPGAVRLTSNEDSNTEKEVEKTTRNQSKSPRRKIGEGLAEMWIW